MKLLSALRWALPLLLALNCLLGSNAFADPVNESYDGRTSCGTGWTDGATWVKKSTVPTTLGTVENYECGMQASWGWALYKNGSVVVCDINAMISGSSCVCNTQTGAFYDSATNSCGCPAGKEMNQWTKSCVAPCPAGSTRTDPAGACSAPICNAPKLEINGVCSCPAGTIADGETCKTKPDCSSKTAECSASCGGANGSMSGVSYYYCRAATSSDPSTQLFNSNTYRCDCAQKDGCPEGQIKIIAADGTASCGNSKNPGCPEGSHYGDFNGLTGCIKTNTQNDPDEAPNNCISGTNSVYYGSTLYCVPKPEDPEGQGCPTGTTETMAGSLRICSRTDSTGNSTGDSPDTNNSIKGIPVDGSGSGTGTGDGSGTSTATGEYDAAIAARLADIKANTDVIKSSSAQTNANTQTTANNTTDIKNALTGDSKNRTEKGYSSAKAQLDSEIAQLKIDLKSKFSEVRADMQAFLNFSANTPSGSGSLPCLQPITFHGQNIKICLADYNEELSIIGVFISALGFLLAGIIILRS